MTARKMKGNYLKLLDKKKKVEILINFHDETSVKVITFNPIILVLYLQAQQRQGKRFL
jgi:hypothetical protein